MTDDFLPIARPDISDEEIAEVVDTLRSGWLTFGPKTQRFEEEFRAVAGAEHAVAVNSCTSGMHLALLAAVRAWPAQRQERQPERQAAGRRRRPSRPSR